MNVLYFTIPITFLLSVSAIVAFYWATRSGQWDDLDLKPKELLQDPTAKEKK